MDDKKAPSSEGASHSEQGDEPKPDLITEVSRLTLEDIKGFFDEKLVNHQCPCCANTNWMILSEGKTLHGLLLQQIDGPAFVPPPMVPLVSVVCNGCGYVRSHAATPVVEWKLERDG